MKKIITLSNGVRVGNFSSPHVFNFEDGNVLPACDVEDVSMGKLIEMESSKSSILHRDIQDVELRYEMSSSCETLIGAWMQQWLLGEVHVVITPLPVMKALYEEHGDRLILMPFRTGRVKDRMTKELFIDRFCIYI